MRKADPDRVEIDPQPGLVGLRVERIIGGDDLAAQQPVDPPGIQIAARKRRIAIALDQQGEEERVGLCMPRTQEAYLKSWTTQTSFVLVTKMPDPTWVLVLRMFS